MRSDVVDVVVVGGGPTGLTLALQAVAHGATVRVLDRRPEAFRPASPGGPALEAVVRGRRFGGATVTYQLSLPTGESLELVAAPDAWMPGDRVRVAPTGEGLHLFAGEGR